MIFICPATSNSSWHYLRPLIVADGTFLKVGYMLTPLLAVGIDGSEQIIQLA